MIPSSSIPPRTGDDFLITKISELSDIISSILPVFKYDGSNVEFAGRVTGDPRLLLITQSSQFLFDSKTSSFRVGSGQWSTLGDFSFAAGKDNEAQAECSGVVAGNSNLVTAPTSVVLAGTSNKIETGSKTSGTYVTGSDSAVVCGYGNECQDSQRSAVLAGQCCKLLSCIDSVISGSNSSLSNCGGCSLNGVTISADESNQCFLSGEGHKVTSSGKCLITGLGHSLTSCSSCFLAGENHSLVNCQRCAILAGSTNSIGSGSLECAILMGVNNTLPAQSVMNCIVNGYCCGMTRGTAGSTILTGQGVMLEQSSTAYTSRLRVGGSLQLRTRTVTGTYTMGLDDYYIFADVSSGNVQVITSTLVDGLTYEIKLVNPTGTNRTCIQGGRNEAIRGINGTQVSSIMLGSKGPFYLRMVYREVAACWEVLTLT